VLFRSLDLYEQFCRILKVDFKDRAVPFHSFHRDFLHTALLAAFLSGVARREVSAGHYKLVGGRESHIFPGSDLYGKSMEWVVAAEVRETSRVFLARAAEIQPEWILKVAEPFCNRRWFEPMWNPQRGFVEVLEEVSFRGMVLTRGRRVDYGRIDPAACCEIFFREAVVEGNIARPFPFMEANERVIDSLHGMEARLRRFGLAPAPELQVAWYTARFPHILNMKTLQDHLRAHGDKDLRFDAEEWLSEKKSSSITTTEAKAFKESGVEVFRVMGHSLQGRLVFDAGRADDGLSLTIPAELWKELTPAKLALHLQQWREWMLRPIAEAFRERLDDAWCDLLEKRSEEPPLLLLYEAIAKEKKWNISIPAFNPQKDHYLCLHLLLQDAEQNKKIPLELSPEWGAAKIRPPAEPADPKTWRQRFRPIIASRIFTGASLQEILSLLDQLDQKRKDMRARLELETQAHILWDSSRLTMYRKQAFTEETDTLEEADLLRLKQHFKR
jgi:hypothetical protein